MPTGSHYSTKISSCVKDMGINCSVDIQWGTITNDATAFLTWRIEVRFVEMCLMAAGVRALLSDLVAQYGGMIVVTQQPLWHAGLQVGS